MNTPTRRRRRILAAVRSELMSARRADQQGDVPSAFWHLERAHVLGQGSTVIHVRVHWHMLRWAIRHWRAREVAGQLLRIIGAATKTPFGWIPHGNTGGSNVKTFRPMTIPPDLQRQLDSRL